MEDSVVQQLHGKGQDSHVGRLGASRVASLDPDAWGSEAGGGMAADDGTSGREAGGADAEAKPEEKK